MSDHGRFLESIVTDVRRMVKQEPLKHTKNYTSNNYQKETMDWF